MNFISTLVLVLVESISLPSISALHSLHLLPFTSLPLSTDVQCTASLTESIPKGLTYTPLTINHLSTYIAWDTLLHKTVENISIASFYWSMLREDVFNSSTAHQGENIFGKLLQKSKDAKVNIVTSGPPTKDNDLEKLIAAGAKVDFLDVSKILSTGVQHAKLWTVDNRHGYIGSANMDWRSLTQVKEMGLTLFDCPALATDLGKIIGAFCHVAKPDVVFPITWGPEYTTIYNLSNPMRIILNGRLSEVFISMSPSQFKPTGREDDLKAILSVIEAASSFIYVAVMDFQPVVKSYHDHHDQFWPVLTDALVKASMQNGVEVRILLSEWAHSSPNLRHYMISFRALHGVNGARIRIRFFVVPSVTPEQKSIPFARVNHNKYMVTEKTLYIGTSNWSGDYFKHSGGAGVVISGEGNTMGSNGEKPLRLQLEEVFLRDWNSMFADEL